MGKTRNLTKNDEAFLLKAWEFQMAGKGIKDLAEERGMKVSSTNSKLSQLRSIENLEVPTFERQTRADVSVDSINDAIKSLKNSQNKE